MDLMKALTDLALSLANLGSVGRTLGPIVKPATETHTLSGCSLSHVLICFFILGVSRALLIANPEKVRFFVSMRSEDEIEQGSTGTGFVGGVDGSDELDAPLLELFDGGGAVSDMVNVTSFVLLRNVDVPVTVAVNTQLPTAV